MENKNSVEFQIMESDVIREVEKRLGEEEVDLTRRLFGLGEDNFGLGVLMLLFKTVINADEEDLHRLVEVMTITKHRDIRLYNLLEAFLTEMLYKKVDDNHGN